jgi:hypothetical protein
LEEVVVEKRERERERERERAAMETAMCGRVPLSPNHVFNPTKPGTLSLSLSLSLSLNCCFNWISKWKIRSKIGSFLRF